MVKKINKTTGLLDFSGSKNSTIKKDDESTNGSSPHALHSVRPLKINLCENTFYSLMSPMIKQASSSSMEEQLVNLAKIIED